MAIAGSSQTYNKSSMLSFMPLPYLHTHGVVPNRTRIRHATHITDSSVCVACAYGVP